MFQKELKKENKELLDENRLFKNDVDAKKRIISQLEEKIRIMEKDLGYSKREEDLRVEEAISLERGEHNKTKEENARLSERNQILEKAFENMGFDVKDMKEVLNKLVDGLIAKNEIKLVK